MTDIEPARSAAVATASPMSGVEGLEDIGVTDLVLPILKINHKENGFEDSLTGEVKSSLKVIILGVVKQRILWPADPGAEGEGPICRSYDFSQGIPDPDKFLSIVEKQKTGHPTGFSRDAIEGGGPLDCGSCPLKDWGTHPRGDKPWCDEQWTVPLLVLDDDGGYSPALISFQRTGIKPIKNYVTAFASRKQPLYVAVTRLEAVQQFKGTNPYTVPKFIKDGDSDPASWPEYSAAYNNIRGFISKPRPRRGEEDDAPTTTTASAPAPAAAPAPAEPAPAPAAAVTAEVSEEARPSAHRAQPSSTAAPAPAPAAEDPDEVPF